MGNILKILVIDDTVTDRKILSTVLSTIGGIELVGTAPNGRIGLTKIGLKKPDLVLLDLFMPEMDGLETLKQIRSEYPGTDVIMISGVNREDAGMTMKALEAGAVDFIPKPSRPTPEESFAELRANLARLIPIAQTRKYSRQVRGISKLVSENRVRTSAPPVAATRPPRRQRTEIPKAVARRISGKPNIEVIAIGVSTGGPNALQSIIPNLDAGLCVPIVAVQHMPATFTASLALRLDTESAIRVVEGEEGALLENGVMYIAPGGRHMVVRQKRNGGKVIGLTDSLPVNSCRPSVDVLLRSLNMAYGGNVLTVILTGMGNDGASGVAAIRRKGGYTIVQDEKTSVVWGMPGSVAQAGNADEIVPLGKIADRIMAMVKN